MKACRRFFIVIHKGYHAEDILEQCHKLEEAGIDAIPPTGFDICSYEGMVVCSSF